MTKYIMLALFLSTFLTQVWGNLLFLLMDNAYYIPTESSIFIFDATVFNEGSGEWWVYGEDYRNYYYNFGSDKATFISKGDSSKCNLFNPLNIETWCR